MKRLWTDKCTWKHDWGCSGVVWSKGGDRLMSVDQCFVECNVASPKYLKMMTQTHPQIMLYF